MCRRQHRAAWWWPVGDRPDSLGLLGATPGAAGAVVAVPAGRLEWGWLRSFAILFPIGAVAFQAGARLKGHAYALGERDGISPAEVFVRGRSGPAGEWPGRSTLGKIGRLGRKVC